VAGTIALLAANAACGAYEFAWPPIDHHPVANVIRVALSAACIAAVARRRRSAFERSAWLVLFTLAAVFPVYFVHDFGWELIGARAAQVALALAVPVVLVARRATIFVMPKPAAGRFAELAGAVRLTIALFLIAETASHQVVRVRYPFLIGLSKADEQFVLNSGRRWRDAPSGIPSVAFLGSSPTNTEIVTRRPVGAILAERFAGILDIQWSDYGGVTTGMMAERARRLIAETSRQRPRAFVLHVGFDDQHRSPVRQYLRQVDDIGENRILAGGVSWLVRHSSLVALSLKGLIECQSGRLECWGRDFEETFPYLRANTEEILRASSGAGIPVLVVTLAGNTNTMSPEYRSFTERVNPYLRDLPARFPNVTLVDFAAAVEASYPRGPGPDCAPFEAGREPGACGNAVHLGPAGHALMADLLEPRLRALLRSPE
jgi:lysophospholipase L1-like esterase